MYLEKLSIVSDVGQLRDNDVVRSAPDAEDDVESSNSDSSDEESELENFIPVLKTIDLKALASSAINTRLRYERQKSTAADTTTEDLTCSIQEPPFIGSYNIAFVILFSDDVKWIARIPGSGNTCFGELEAQRLLSTIRTTALTPTRTSIPIPGVFSWVLTQDNPVNVPYHLESFIEGVPLSDRWTSQFSDEETRMQILRNLAELMSQLHALQFR